jgi:hypothetical protein
LYEQVKAKQARGSYIIVVLARKPPQGAAVVGGEARLLSQSPKRGRGRVVPILGDMIGIALCMV